MILIKNKLLINLKKKNKKKKNRMYFKMNMKVIMQIRKLL